MGFRSTMVRPLAIISCLAALTSPALAAINEQDFAPDDIIIRDVCILGGGSTGTYAAISLKDKAKTVVVVERNELLGGHTETLYLPDDQYIDYGVEGVFNNDLTRAYFSRLDVESKPLLPNTLINENVNFKTGEKVPPPSGILGTTSALIAYRLAIQKYTYLHDGVYNLPDPVPAELLRPFGEFVEKNNLHGALQLIFLFTHSIGDILQAPLLRVMQSFGIAHVDALLEGGYIVPKTGMYELYNKASEVLGSDVLYRSTVVETERADTGVRIVVESATGARKLIKAKTFLATIPPTLDNLRGFDLAPDETALFEKWTWMNYYVAVVKNTGIPSDVTVWNADPGNTPGNLPTPPCQAILQYLGVDGYLTSKIVGDRDFSVEQAKELVISDIRRMGAKGTYPGGDPEMVVFGSHSPEVLVPGNEDIEEGFYKRLYELQGVKSTFWTGGTFCSDYSALLWAYTETVVQRMVSE